MRCSAILVNYHSASLISAAAESLIADPACELVHVLDNSESDEEVRLLRETLAPKVKLTVCPKNLGFAGACNLGFAQSDADFVLLLNPDARLFPGALNKLLSFLEHKEEAAAVGPRVYWDSDKAFTLPPTTYPSRRSFLFDRLGERWPRLSLLRSIKFRNRALVEWLNEQPFRVDALSGGHVLLRRRAIEHCGGLFDPRFFMYWEDSDLMRRLNDHGFQLWMEPSAEAVHLYEHSPNKDKLISDGWPIFVEKYFSTKTWRLISSFSRGGHGALKLPKFTPVSLGNHQVFSLTVPDSMQDGWLLEFSPSPLFIPAMGQLGTGPQADLPLELAQRFSTNVNYLRLGPNKPVSPDQLLYFSSDNGSPPSAPA